MKISSAKISLFIVIGIIFSACNSTKRIPEGKLRLGKNEILVNGKKVTDEEVHNQLYQKPNSFVFQDFFKKNKRPPVVLDTSKTKKSLLRLKQYYVNGGFFEAKTSYKIDTLKAKKASVKYIILTGNSYFIDTLSATIQTPVLDSLYQASKTSSFIKPKNQFKIENFENEKNRITGVFRNNGAYNFQPNYVKFDIDTINKKNKANINLIIKNYSYQKNDSTKTEPFKIYKISDVRIYTDYSAANSKAKITDSTTFKNFNLYSREKLKYKPRAITDAVFITKGSLFSDKNTVLTSRYLNNLKIFNYPAIQYEIDSRDSTAQSLIAKLYLTPRKKYSFGLSGDLTHSNIQDFGISGTASVTIRNIFNAAETFEITPRASVGASKDMANPKNNFFNVSEYGIDAKINFPRILMPFRTEKIIHKSMIPSTQLALGVSKQTNIGLDKENIISSLSYSWTPKEKTSVRFDLFNVQYVHNLFPQNYFNVYRSSYNALNAIAQNYLVNPAYLNGNNLIIESGTDGFVNDAIATNPFILLNAADYKTVQSIDERRKRLTENDFILASSYTFTKNTKQDILDNNFYVFRTKLESAGSLLSLIANTARLPKNNQGKYNVFNLQYSQYLKSEFEYIKNWRISKENVFAMRTFFGIAIPFGNSNSIPFSRSYFAGGSNDNRAWQPYSLGPGSSGATNDFNEANMKIALSGEYRFKIFASLKGALFADAGNIWNVADNVTDEKSIFKGVKNLNDIALGSGFGFRYDLSFFVVRIDLGFKTYNPAKIQTQRWFTDYSWNKMVLNFGINYPF